MAVCLGGIVRSVTIDPDWDDGPERFGDAEIEWRQGEFTEQELRDKAVLVALAGPVAEMIHTGDPFHPAGVAEWSVDWSVAWRAASSRHADEKRRLAYLEQTTLQLYQTLGRDDYWAALAAIVDHLLAHETLEGDEVEEIVRQPHGCDASFNTTGEAVRDPKNDSRTTALAWILGVVLFAVAGLTAARFADVHVPLLAGWKATPTVAEKLAVATTELGELPKPLPPTDPLYKSNDQLVLRTKTLMLKDKRDRYQAAVDGTPVSAVPPASEAELQQRIRLRRMHDGIRLIKSYRGTSDRFSKRQIEWIHNLPLFVCWYDGPYVGTPAVFFFDIERGRWIWNEGVAAAGKHDQDGWSRIIEIDRAGKVVWQFESKTSTGRRIEVHAFQRLKNGTTMIVQSRPARILEVDKAGKIAKTVRLKVDQPSGHSATRLARKLNNGHYLVCHEKDGAVREYDAEGKVVWEFNVPLFGKQKKPGHGLKAFGNQCFSAVRLPSGNTLIGTGNGHSVLEVTPEKKIVWKIEQNDLPGIQLAWVTTLQVLPSGNIVIGNCHAGPGNPQIIEVTRDKKVVWTFKDFKRFGNALSNSRVLAVDGKAVK
eukprot:g33062.t1